MRNNFQQMLLNTGGIRSKYRGVKVCTLNSQERTVYKYRVRISKSQRFLSMPVNSADLAAQYYDYAVYLLKQAGLLGQRTHVPNFPNELKKNIEAKLNLGPAFNYFLSSSLRE